MQNHGGYNQGWYNLPRTIALKGTMFGTSSYTEQYLALMRKTDDALKELIDYYSKVDEPTMIVLFGDHQGKLTTAFYDQLSELSAQLGAAPVECIHGRAEEQALLEGYRDCYDLAVSRAVADLRILAELCLPFVKVGGQFLAMKSDNCQEEVERAGRAIAKLGGQLRPMAQYQIPGTEITRRVVVVEKIRPTPKGYPRRFSRMKKAPL